MITSLQLINNIKTYILLQLDNMSKTNPVINFTKPLITRVLDKNISKLNKFTDLISDENGNIDIENILNEMMSNVINSNPFTINTEFIGNIEIGNGNISLNIPFTDKKLILNEGDLISLKEALTRN